MSETTTRRNSRMRSKGRPIFGRDVQIKQDLEGWKRDHNPAEVREYRARLNARVGLTLFDDSVVLRPTESVRIEVLARDRECRLVTADCHGEIDARYINEAGGRTNRSFDAAHAVALCDFHEWVMREPNTRGLATRRLIRSMLGLGVEGTHNGG